MPLGPASLRPLLTDPLFHPPPLFSRAQNYPTDNYLSVYFGDGLDRTAVGEAAFKAQLFQAQVAQALNVAMAISNKRLSNCFGTMIWQLGAWR